MDKPRFYYQDLNNYTSEFLQEIIFWQQHEITRLSQSKGSDTKPQQAWARDDVEVCRSSHMSREDKTEPRDSTRSDIPQTAGEFDAQDKPGKRHAQSCPSADTQFHNDRDGRPTGKGRAFVPPTNVVGKVSSPSISAVEGNINESKAHSQDICTCGHDRFWHAGGTMRCHAPECHRGKCEKFTAREAKA